MVSPEIFLHALFPDEAFSGGGLIQLRVIPEDRGGERKPSTYHFREMAKAVAYRQKPGCHLYFSPVLRTGASGGRGQDYSTLLLTHCLWADVDGKAPSEGPLNLVEALAKCRGAGLPPTFVVRSGMGEKRGHLYLLLADADHRQAA